MHVRPRQTLRSTVVGALTLGICGCASHQPRVVTSTTQAIDRITLDQGGIVRGDTSRKTLALVFTGGDYAEGVPTILSACAARHVPATFFVTGDFLRHHADAARSILAAGQSLGPHSDRHPLYCDWTDRSRSLVTRDAFEADLKQNFAELAALSAERPRYFLPPFEWFNDDQVAWSRAMGLTLINFTPGSGSNRDYIPESDPKFVASSQIVADVLAYERRDPHGLNGYFLLFHAGSLRRDKVHDHLGALLGDLQARGYRFVSLDELLR